MLWMFIGITATCLLIVLICGICLAHFYLMPDILEVICIIILTVSLVIAILINPLVLMTHNSSYKKFKIKYELKTQLYNSATNKSDTIIILDIAEINKDLIEMQSEKKTWGRLCYYPDDILDYKLIGVEEKS